MSHLYRKSALEKLSSPEQIDRMVVITPMSVWLAALAGALLTAAVLLWGFHGTIPVTKSCQGCYFDMGPVNSVYSETEGIVKECSLTTGDEIQKGDILFIIKDAEGTYHKVKSEFSGAAYSVCVQKGSYVSAGTKLIEIREKSTADSGYVYCYVPLEQARQIKAGMEVMIYPNYLNTKEYGHMTGTVESVSEFILNRGDLEAQMGDSDMIDQLLSGQFMIGVRCELELDENSENGYHWSNKKGNTLELTNGTMVNVDIVVEEKTPVELLF